MFRVQVVPVNIVIERCGFDVNGWNHVDFLSVLLIASPGDAPQEGRDVVIWGNVFFDSNPPGIEGCDQGQDECVTRQRSYIVVQNVDGIWIEDNKLSGGGRIGAGGSGRDILSGQNIYTPHFTGDYQPSSAIPSPLVTIFACPLSPGVMTSPSLPLALVF